MKKKNGFTLIELLAVIVILAIIALIATPIVLGLISRARKGAATDSAYGVRKEAQLLYSTALMGHPAGFNKIVVDFSKEVTKDGKKYPEAKYYATSSVTDENAKIDEIYFEIDGTKPSSGIVTINGNGKVTYENIVINGYNCTIPNTGNVTCGGESLNGDNTSEPEKIITYGYSTASTGYKKDDSTTLSYTRPTSRNAYLKYTLINGIVDEEILPEACVYYETYGGELCLKYDDYNNSISKIKTFFKWDDEAKKSEYDYVICNFNETSGSCQNPNIGANSGPNGRVGAGDYSAGGCSVESRTYFGCS